MGAWGHAKQGACMGACGILQGLHGRMHCINLSLSMLFPCMRPTLRNRTCMEATRTWPAPSAPLPVYTGPASPHQSRAGANSSARARAFIPAGWGRKQREGSYGIHGSLLPCQSNTEVSSVPSARAFMPAENGRNEEKSHMECNPSGMLGQAQRLALVRTCLRNIAVKKSVSWSCSHVT